MLAVVAILTVKPESVDTVLRHPHNPTAVEEVHEEPGCQLNSVHQSDETFVFIERWADEEALKVHSTAPAIGKLFAAAGDHLAGPPDIKTLQPLPADDPDKGQLRKSPRLIRRVPWRERSR
ncbi:putative quinol monooxygenase [Mycobacterium tilburgii]|uniref:putative quinol monooxygenase n=1 Tax=Mycobacterium tilburgii TaxID=44467 RepID=UPI001181DC34|nr:putative quinol monooxygenase [Mycobacterium tilburgii]